MSFDSLAYKTMLSLSWWSQDGMGQAVCVMQITWLTSGLEKLLVPSVALAGWHFREQSNGRWVSGCRKIRNGSAFQLVAGLSLILL